VTHGLTPRQSREVEYHAHHADLLRDQPALYEVLSRRKSKWWNHYWVAHAKLLAENIAGKKLLVPGCGQGTDAIVAAKLGARVSAFDISLEMLELASRRASDANAAIDLGVMPAERLSYQDSTFDVVYVRDVLHHCDVAQSIAELRRVSKDHALVVVDELYTHSLLQRMRTAGLGRWLYRGIRPIIYGKKAYITEDERKLDERDLSVLVEALSEVRIEYFNVVVNRFVPGWDAAEMADRVLMKCLPGRIVAGRFVLTGRIRKG